MSYTSPGYEHAVVFDETNWHRHATKGYGAGYVPRDWDRCPLGYCSAEFNLPLIPEDEWVERIKEQDEQGTSLSHVQSVYGIKSRSQGQTNSCWAYSVVQAMRYQVARQTGFVLDFSPTSTICLITGFQNRGGWCSEFVEGVQKYGIALEDEWKLNDFSRGRATNDVLEKMKRRVQTEFIDFPARGLSSKQRAQYMISTLLADQPLMLPVGCNWMSHAVTHKRAAIVKDKIVIVSDNSGLYRDQNGETVFSLERATYDDAIAPTVMRIVAEDLV